MKFFFDKHHSWQTLEALRAEKGADVIHIEEAFPSLSEDRDWIPEVGKLGWALISGDYHTAIRREEKRVFRESGLIAFFMAATWNGKTQAVRQRWIITQWDRIEEEAEAAQAGDCFVVREQGKLRKLEADLQDLRSTVRRR